LDGIFEDDNRVKSPRLPTMISSVKMELSQSGTNDIFIRSSNLLPSITLCYKYVYCDDMYCQSKHHYNRTYEARLKYKKRMMLMNEINYDEIALKRAIIKIGIKNVIID
jgi:hypothetical protein